MNKSCTKCLKEQETTSFSPRKKSPDGLHFWCRSCVREYDKSNYALRSLDQKAKKCKAVSAWKKRRTEEFNLKFKSGPCSDCGGKFHPAAMQFDHLRDKEFNIGDKKTAFSFVALESEIAKCELVCSNCHAVRTYKRLQSEDLDSKPGSTLKERL